MLINRLLPPPTIYSSPNKLTNIILILAIIAISIISIGIRAYHITPTGDDIIYSYKLGAEFQSNLPIIGEIHGLSDAIESQINQYFHTNGRFLIHTVLQLVAGLSPHTGFAIIAGGLIGTGLILLVIFTIPPRHRANTAYWLAGAVMFLYLFPSNSCIWLSISICCNYLIPITLVLSWLVLYRKWHDTPSVGHITHLSVLGFVTGFSHEAFALTLSGALFIRAVKHFKAFFTRQSIPVICLWIGTLLVVASPGNFARQAKEGGDIILKLFHFLQLLSSLRILYISVAIAIVSYFTDRRAWIEATSRNSLILYALLFAILFGAVANTGIWSLTAIEFYSAILAMAYLNSLFKGRNFSGTCTTMLAAACVIILCVHQTAIIKAQMKQYDAEEDMIHSFTHSPIGLAEYNPPTFNSIIDPYVCKLSMTGWDTHSIALKYADGKKPCILVGADDMAIINKEASISRFLIPGTASLYKGNFNLWSLNASPTPVIITFQRIKRPLLDLLRPKDAPDTFTWKPNMCKFSGTGTDLFYIFPYPSQPILSADNVTE